MQYFIPAQVTISALNASGWDADLIAPAAFAIHANHIQETTLGHGTEIDTIGTDTRGVIMVLGGD